MFKMPYKMTIYNVLANFCTVRQILGRRNQRNNMFWLKTIRWHTLKEKKNNCSVYLPAVIAGWT